MAKEPIKVEDKRHSSVPAEETPAQETGLVLAAIQNKMPVEFIEQMMDLQDRYDEKEARKAYFKAVAKFKSNIPTVLKDKINQHTDNSPYSSIGNLLGTVNPELGKHDLSASFNIKDSDDFAFITVSGILTHSEGHSEKTSMTFDVETTGAKGGQVMTKTHARMSALTYAMKATFSAIVGIAAIDPIHDDDGNAAGGKAEIGKYEGWQIKVSEACEAAQSLNDIIQWWPDNSAQVKKDLNKAGAAKIYAVFIARKNELKAEEEREAGGDDG